MVAASSGGPGGFSYAQAAKNRPAAQAATNSPASTAQSAQHAASTPAAKLDELDVKGNWAEEVDASEKEQNPAQSQRETKPTEVKSIAVERTKLESRTQSSISGISSPSDLAGSATSHEDVSPGPNGSSHTSWEAKSQGSDPVASSEPAWIAERKERQHTTQKQADTTPNGVTTEAPQSKPLLHDAPPPAVNPWAKRAVDQKVKVPSQPIKRDSQARDENSKPNSTAAVQTPSAPANNAQNPKDAVSHRNTESTRAVVRANGDHKPPHSWSARSDQQSGYSASVAKDSVSWPTPENSQEPERKSSLEIKAQDDNAEDGQSGKPRKKQEWKAVPVVPNIIWQTPGVRDRAPRSAPNGERPARGGGSTRGRGNGRGGAQTGTDRAAPSAKGADANAHGATAVEPASNEGRAAAPVASVRASSVSSRHGEGRSTSASVPSSANGSALKNAVETRPAQQTDEVNGDNHETQRAESIPPPAATDAPVTNGTAPTTAESSHAAQGSTEPRRDPKEATWTPPSRGARRGRGRGGNRDVVNGHIFTNQNGDPAQFGHFDGPMSAVHPPRGNPSFNHYGRGSNRSSGYRAQSLPIEALYGYGRPNPYMPQSPLLGMPTYQPGMQEMYSYPVSPVPFSPSQDQSNLAAIGHQIDYYFSVDNLLKDMYLRKNMDGQGFVLLDTVAAFKQITKMTQDREALKAACQFSEVVEIRIGDDGRERLRPVREPTRWVLEISERVEAARNEGPNSFDTIHRAPGSLNFQPSQMPLRGPHPPPFPMMPFRPGDRRSQDFSSYMNALSPQAMYSPEFAPHFQPEFVNGGGNLNDHQAKSPQKDQAPDLRTSSQPNGNVEHEPDVFPNEQIQQLTVCVKLSKDNIPPYSSTTRTFSHGSIDADLTGAAEKETPKEKPSSQQASSTEKAASDDSSTTDRKEGHSAQDVSVFWIKDDDKPVSMLPSNLTPEPYLQLRHKALEQRSRAADGTCPYDLDVLYQFWSHFLIRNFNHNMYSDFKHFAGQDAMERHNTVGKRNLSKYYDQALNSVQPIPMHVAKDYLDHIQAELQASPDDRPAFKTLHRSWRNGALNMRNRKRLADMLEGELKQLLED